MSTKTEIPPQSPASLGSALRSIARSERRHRLMFDRIRDGKLRHNHPRLYPCSDREGVLALLNGILWGLSIAEKAINGQNGAGSADPIPSVKEENASRQKEDSRG